MWLQYLDELMQHALLTGKTDFSAAKEIFEEVNTVILCVVCYRCFRTHHSHASMNDVYYCLLLFDRIAFRPVPSTGIGRT